MIKVINIEIVIPRVTSRLYFISMEETQCPSCNGAVTYERITSFDDSPKIELVNCSYCMGAGFISTGGEGYISEKDMALIQKRIKNKRLKIHKLAIKKAIEAINKN